MLSRAIVAAASVLLLSGCTTGRYLAQAGCGQIDLMLRARDLDRAVADPHVPARIRGLLAQVGAIKKFGERHSLRPTGNYHRYVELDRPVVVWVVQASDPLRFHSKTWWFPIVGRVPYLGWFERDAAYDFARELREEGLDVDVGGAEAYSTLGWFDDPVLSTMISDGDEAIGELADVVLHESVHATLYVDGQTRFNESLAEFTSDRLTSGTPELGALLEACGGELRALLRRARGAEAQGRVHGAEPGGPRPGAGAADQGGVPGGERLSVWPGGAGAPTIGGWGLPTTKPPSPSTA